MRLSTLKRFLADDGIEELLELVRLDALASNGDLTAHDYCQRKREEFGVEALKPSPLLRGRDLLDAGFLPGPEIGQILDAVMEAQLEGALQSREQALDWVRERYQS
jgi:poly(A) polymerase